MQNRMCECHGSGPISSLFPLMILHGRRASIAGASQVLKRVQFLEQAATEQQACDKGAQRRWMVLRTERRG